MYLIKFEHVRVGLNSCHKIFEITKKNVTLRDNHATISSIFSKKVRVGLHSCHKIFEIKNKMSRSETIYATISSIFPKKFRQFRKFMPQNLWFSTKFRTDLLCNNVEFENEKRHHVSFSCRDPRKTSSSELQLILILINNHYY